jgi:hypothetical protein
MLFAFGASPLLAGCLIGSHGAAMLVVGLQISNLWMKFLLFALILASLLHGLLLHAWRRLPSAIVQMQCGEASLEVETRAGERYVCQLLADSLITPLLVVLRVRREGRRLSRALVIVPDAMERQAFRQLRVWFNWKVQAAV